MVLFSMKTPNTLFGLAAAGCAQAHMFLATPVRFASPVVTSGPILADGSNFPCQAGSTGQYTPNITNVYPLGSQQLLAFLGTAVHGGGSGQVAITYDTSPRPDSVFKVIKSFEGGFVAENQAGNMGNDAFAVDPYTYTFDVPKNIPTGDATVLITWFNKIGNRESYNFCAPISLTGAGGDKANYDALPDVFLANIGNGCGTVDATDLIFPDPGQIVERLNGATSAFASATGAGCKTGSGRTQATGSSGSSGGSGGSGGSGATSASPGIFVTSPTQQAAPPRSSTSTPGFSGPYSVTGSFSITHGAPTETIATKPPPPASTTATASGGSGSGGGSDTASGSGAALSGACTTEGEFNCIDGTKYQQCGSGIWSVAMPVAPGTKCTGGRGATLNIVAAKLRYLGVRFEA